MVLRTDYTPGGEPGGGRDTNTVYGIDLVEIATQVNTNTTDIAAIDVPTWMTLVGKPAVIAAGATQAEARTAIGAATLADITAAVDALISGAPGALDTLNELAAALGDDANFAATVTGLINAKYTKPGTGIPKTDLDAAVQTSLGLADTATQPGDLGTAAATDATDYATAAQGALADTALQGIPDNSVTQAKMADDAVGVAELSATGTPDGTTFLRGDNTWSTPAGGGGGISNVVDDTTPQLGGDLDLNTHTVGAATDADLTKLHNTGTLSGNNTGDQNLSGYAPLASPAFTGTPTGITKIHVGLGNVDNTADTAKPVSTAQATAISAKVSKGELVVNVKDYGAVGNNVADDTAAIQAAHDALTAGGRLYFPPGAYYMTGTVNITNNVTIEGASRGDLATLGDGVYIIVKTGGVSPFVVSTGSVTFRQLTFVGYGVTYANSVSGQATAITFASGNRHIVEQCTFQAWYKELWFQNCESWVVRDCYFDAAAKYQIHIQNVALPDSGDQVVSGNTFVESGSWSLDAQVRQESAGGTKYTDNKFYAATANRCIDVAIADGVNTSILLASNNSFESFLVSAIRVTQAGPLFTGTFQKTIVNSNQFTVRSSGPAIDIDGLSTNNAGIRTVVISANQMDGRKSDGNAFINVSKARNVLITANQFTTGTTGVTINSNSQDVRVDSSNQFQDVDTLVSGAPGFNNEVSADTFTKRAYDASNPDQLFVGAITRNASGAPVSAAVVWPDGRTGTYTGTASGSFPSAVDSYTITYILTSGLGNITKTFTQPTITRNVNGAVINRPQIVMS